MSYPSSSHKDLPKRTQLKLKGGKQINKKMLRWRTLRKRRNSKHPRLKKKLSCINLRKRKLASMEYLLQITFKLSKRRLNKVEKWEKFNSKMKLKRSWPSLRRTKQLQESQILIVILETRMPFKERHYPRTSRLLGQIKTWFNRNKTLSSSLIWDRKVLISQKHCASAVN